MYPDEVWSHSIWISEALLYSVVNVVCIIQATCTMVLPSCSCMYSLWYMVQLLHVLYVTEKEISCFKFVYYIRIYGNKPLRTRAKPRDQGWFYVA